MTLHISVKLQFTDECCDFLDAIMEDKFSLLSSIKTITSTQFNTNTLYESFLGIRCIFFGTIWLYIKCILYTPSNKTTILALTWYLIIPPYLRDQITIQFFTARCMRLEHYLYQDYTVETKCTVWTLHWAMNSSQGSVLHSKQSVWQHADNLWSLIQRDRQKLIWSLVSDDRFNTCVLNSQHRSHTSSPSSLCQILSSA